MPSAPSPVRVAIAGMLSLAVAMGIGRFAFTPLLPLMLAQHLVDLSGASWLASANYLGYLLGALACTLQPWLWHHLPWLPPPRGGAVVRFG
ncbi:MAG TPA: YbfB/YjiJ family MFS transporter, partial [Ramlibacter sp.]|nr:YbfB/YjiJ family MFS transporter [Ramlibacter sp.]